MALLPSQVRAGPLTPGNLAIYRVGTGASGLSSAATAVFIDEYTTSGTLVQSIALPTTISGSNLRLTASGTDSSEGLLSLSSDGRYLMLTGYDANVGRSSVANTNTSEVVRVVGRIDVETGATDTSTSTTSFSGTSIRSAASTNGTDVWMTGGNNGVRHNTLGGSGAGTHVSSASTTTNLRQLNIFDGQLYVSTGAGSSFRIGAVGAGTPTTSGHTITNLNGISTSGSPYSFFFADLDASVAGVDTLYVAYDDGFGGVRKFSLVAGVWEHIGTVGTDADDFRGLTGFVSGSTVTLYATRKGGTGSSGGGELVTLTDSSGYNGTLSGSFSLLASAANQTAFRGVVYIAPIPEPSQVALGLAVILLATSITLIRRKQMRYAFASVGKPGD